MNANYLTGLLALITASLAACSPVQMHYTAEKPPGTYYASAGDIVLKIEKSDDLPNVSGHADIFGRKRDRGFTEIRYMGMDPSGNPVFRRRDLDIFTTATTMSDSGGFSTFGAQGSAQRIGSAGSANFSASGMTFIPASASVGALPPDTVQFALDLHQSRVVTAGTHGIEVLNASPAGVKFRSY